MAAKVLTYSAAQKTPPVWMADFADARINLMPFAMKLVVASFNRRDAVIVGVGAAGAAANAVSIPVDALTGAIPSGTILDFGAKKFAQLTAAAAAGATALTVEALATALVDADVATYEGSLLAAKSIPSGTLVGRTFAERTANTGFGPADAADDEIYLLAFDIDNTDIRDDGEAYRHGCAVKENYLPNWANLGATLQGIVRAKYSCITGIN